MYLEFFKFSRKPFASIPDPDAFLLTEAAQEAFEGIVDAIQCQEPCTLLTGEAGTGKTALLKWLMTNDDPGVRWIFLDKAQLSWDDLLMLIGQDLSLPENELFSDHLAKAISEKLVKLADWGTHPVLIIDEADHLQSTTLRKLLAWHAANRAENISLTIILSGLKTLVQNFAGAGQGLFPASPFDYFELPRLEPQETRTYISYRLERAGYSGTELFEDEALSLVQKLSGGIPRVINLICELALVLAASVKEPVVTAQTVRESSEYLLLEKCVGAESEMPQKQSMSTLDENKPTATNEGPAVGPAPPPSPQLDRPSARWLWAAASLMLLFIGSGTALLLNSGAIPTKPKNAERLIFKVPPDFTGQKKTQDISPEGSPPHSTVHENITVASGNGQSTPRGEIPASRKATRPLRVSVPYKNTSKASIDIAAEKEPAGLTGQAGEKIPSPSPETTKKALTVHLDDNPPFEAAEKNQLRKRISPVSPLLRAPDSRAKPFSPIAKTQTPRLSVAKQGPYKSPRDISESPSPDLIDAIENGNLEKVRQLLKDGASADSLSTTGETALMKAAWAGHRDIVKILLGYTPHINRQSQEGWTALFYATVKGHKDVVTALLAAGAKPDQSDQDGRTPLMAAAWNGHVDIVHLLLKQNVNLNRKNRDGWTPLMFAALGGYANIVETLLRGGANPAIRNNDGETSAQLAAHQGHTQLLSLLTEQDLP